MRFSSGVRGCCVGAEPAGGALPSMLGTISIRVPTGVGGFGGSKGAIAGGGVTAAGARSPLFGVASSKRCVFVTLGSLAARSDVFGARFVSHIKTSNPKSPMPINANCPRGVYARGLTGGMPRSSASNDGDASSGESASGDAGASRVPMRDVGRLLQKAIRVSFTAVGVRRRARWRQPWILRCKQACFRCTRIPPIALYAARIDATHAQSPSHPRQNVYWPCSRCGLH